MLLVEISGSNFKYSLSMYIAHNTIYVVRFFLVSIDGLDRPAFGEGAASQVAMLLFAVRTYLRCTPDFILFLRRELSNVGFTLVIVRKKKFIL